MSEHAAPAKIAEQAEQGGALAKLLTVSIALAVVPISAYFGFQWYLFPDNSVYAAVAAVVSANLILVIFVAMSMYEDVKNKPKTPTPAEVKKNQ